jgi:predicted aldo/keto reductase-like oxidoreductase
VLQDERIHMLTIGMRSPAEIDANIKVFAGDKTYTNKDRALLAAVGAAVWNDDKVRKMPVE